LQRDLSTIVWSHVPKSETVAFFDDHQNAYERVKTAKWFGFKHLIFEDNYSRVHGDCYSLKQAFMDSGFAPTPTHPGSLATRIKQRARAALGVADHTSQEIPPNDVDAKYLRQNLDVYYEFPPIFRVERTRWGDRSDNDNYPTAEPLLTLVEEEFQQRFREEAAYYNWMCYVRLK